MQCGVNYSAQGYDALGNSGDIRKKRLTPCGGRETEGEDERRETCRHSEILKRRRRKKIDLQPSAFSLKTYSRR